MLYSILIVSEKIMMKAKILIVDSDENVRNSIQLRLEQEGHLVTVAASAEEILSHFNRPGDISLVISEIQLAGKNGFSLIHELLRRDTQMKAILMTSCGKKEEVIQAIRLGVSDYFEKPLDMNELSRAVEKCAKPPTAQIFIPSDTLAGAAGVTKLRLVSGLAPQRESSSESSASTSLSRTDDLPAYSRDSSSDLLFSYTELKKQWSDSFEKEYLIAILSRHDGNVSSAAREAKLDRSNFLRLLRKHHLRSVQYRKMAA